MAAREVKFTDKEGTDVSYYVRAKNIKYTNTGSGLKSSTVQDALTELAKAKPYPPDSASGGTSNSYIIELAKYNITKSDSALERDDEGHYTKEQYDMMYNNAVGFTNAIVDAYNAGYSGVTVPTGTYYFTPIGDLITDPSVDTAHIIWILNMKNFTVDLNGSTFEVVVDSDAVIEEINVAKRPTEADDDGNVIIACTRNYGYYKTKHTVKLSLLNSDYAGIPYTATSYGYKYNLFFIAQSENITICNGVLRGDMYTRTYDESDVNYGNTGENNQEHGSAICPTGSCVNYVYIKNLDMSGFCADAVSGAGSASIQYRKPGWHDWSDNKDPRVQAGNSHSIINRARVYGAFRNIVKDGNSYFSKYYTSEAYDGSGEDPWHLVPKKEYANTAKVDTLLTDFIRVDSMWKYRDDEDEVYPAYMLEQRKKRQFSITNCLGYMRMLPAFNPVIGVLTYTTNDPSANPIRYIPCGYQYDFTLLSHENYIRLQFYMESDVKIAPITYTKNGVEKAVPFGRIPMSIEPRHGNKGSYVDTYLTQKYNKRHLTIQPYLYIDNVNQLPANEADIPTDNQGNKVVYVKGTTVYFWYGDTSNLDGITETSTAGPNNAYLKKTATGLCDIIPKLNSHLYVEDCRIHNNGRGGLAGGVNETFIRGCEFDKVLYRGSFEEGVEEGRAFAENNDIESDGEIDTFPLFSGGAYTNYHLGFEDVICRHAVIDHNIFYSGSGYSGKLLFPTVLTMDFRNNVCYGCNLGGGNTYETHSTNNIFYDTSTGDATFTDVDYGYASRNAMKRHRYYTDNSYYNVNMVANGYRSDLYTYFKNCYFQLAFGANSTPEDSVPRNQHPVSNTVYDTCLFENVGGSYITQTFKSKLKNCKLIRMNNLEVGEIDGCECVNSSILAAPTLYDIRGNVLSASINNVKGMTMAFSMNKPTDKVLASLNKTPELVLTYNNCEINLAERKSRYLFPNWRSSATERYTRFTIIYNNCKFIKQGTENTKFTSPGKQCHLIFNNCDFTELTDGVFYNAFDANATNIIADFKDCVMGSNLVIDSKNMVGRVAYAIAGPTTERPWCVPKGHAYFDTTINKTVYRKNDNSNITTAPEWVDGDGNNV